MEEISNLGTKLLTFKKMNQAVYQLFGSAGIQLNAKERKMTERNKQGPNVHYEKFRDQIIKLALKYPTSHTFIQTRDQLGIVGL